MQKFTRALTREIEVGGERLAVTLSEQGMEVRPVGSRRPPPAVSWAALVCACAGHPTSEPTAEDVTAALQALKAGGGAKPADAGAKEKAGAKGEKADTPAEKSAEAGAQKPAEGELPALLRRIDHW